VDFLIQSFIDTTMNDDNLNQLSPHFCSSIYHPPVISFLVAGPLVYTYCRLMYIRIINFSIHVMNENSCRPQTPSVGVSRDISFDGSKCSVSRGLGTSLLGTQNGVGIL